MTTPITPQSDPTSTPSTSWRRRLALVGGGLAVAGALAFAAPAAHAEEPVPPAQPAAESVVRARLQKICARVPNAEIRIDNAIARLQGDASVKGSLAWLQTKIDEATAAGRTDLATVLQNRLEVRQAQLDLLVAKAGAVDEIKALCEQFGAL